MLEMRRIRKEIQELSQELTGNKYAYVINFDLDPDSIRISKWVELERLKDLEIQMVVKSNDTTLTRTTRWYDEFSAGFLGGKSESRQERESMHKEDLDKIDTAILEKAQAYL